MTRIFIVVLLSLVLMPMPSAWVADILKDWWLDDKAIGWNERIMLIGAAVLLLAATGLLAWKGRRLLATRTIRELRDIPRRKVVVALLSPCDNLEAENGNWHIREKGPDGKRVSTAGMKPENLVAEQSGLPQWTWQQTLRTAFHHHPSLERLVLIGSRGERGSGTPAQLDLARDYFASYFPGKILQSRSGKSRDDSRWTADFEQLDPLLELLRRVIDDLTKSMGYRQSDIVIDCTGGPKVASIAAAMVTLDHPELVFQSVNPKGEVIAFNVVFEKYID